MWHLALFRLTEADSYHVSHILLLHIAHVELLDASHLLVIKPVRRLLFHQLIEHLGIELLIVYLPSIVYILPRRNMDADISARASGIRQRMRIVGCGNK